MDQVQAFLAYPIVQGAITGFVGALAADVSAFRSWKQWNDAAIYDWGIASFRWFQGVVLGALTGAGLGAIS
jgi:hypothetical protein